jgi:NitT/TauT family transport system ATP-binding protein
MASSMPRSLKLNQQNATLPANERERFVTLVEPVRMNNIADVRTLVDAQPRRLAVDVRDVSLTFDTADGKVDALSKVSLQIADGEFVSFIGPSAAARPPFCA